MCQISLKQYVFSHILYNNLDNLADNSCAEIAIYRCKKINNITSWFIISTNYCTNIRISHYNPHIICKYNLIKQYISMMISWTIYTDWSILIRTIISAASIQKYNSTTINCWMSLAIYCKIKHIYQRSWRHSILWKKMTATS